jgi:hypothetical protein
MPERTHIDQARTRVQAEQEAVDAKRDGIDDFIDRVEALSTDPTPTSSTAAIAAGDGLGRTESAPEDHCQAVRTAFVESVRPHSVVDADGSESLLAAIRSEFSDGIAVALAPTTDTVFTAELKRAILSEAATRRAETDVLRRALDRENARLQTAGEVVDDVTTWIADADETPLTDLGFDALERRHDALSRYRTRCSELARDRQAFLGETTSNGVEAGIRHRQLLPSLYEDFPVDHPVLATVARVDDICEECQRAVRNHLVRRA